MTGEIQRLSVEGIVIDGVVKNLPQITDALVETYRLHKKGEMIELTLQAQMTHLRDQKEVFIAVIKDLTELSRAEGTDPKTKDLYREILRDMTASFKSNASSSQIFSNYLNGF